MTQAGASRLQVLYGCSILSFLGAPHWGLGLANWGARLRVAGLCLVLHDSSACAFLCAGAAGMPLANIVRYAWGVMPSLLAWPVPCLPDQPGAAMLCQGLGVAFAADAAFTRANLLPRWYFWHLRVPLTLVATGSLLSTALLAPAPAEPAAAAPPQAASVPPPAPRRWW